MKTIFLLMLCFFSLTAYPFSETRKIIVSGTPEEKTYEAALQKLEARKEALTERDVVIQKEISEKFGIRLIGKDGGEKWKGDQDFTVQEIIEKIDQMPMRLEEIKKYRVIGR